MFLESNCLLDEVEQAIDIGRSMGISSVPLTVINNKWSLVGAQSSDVYYKVGRIAKLHPTEVKH
jgi:predicted DsbA family dithiol-disulfide isomerase